MQRTRWWYILPVIVIAQFCCTSLWFVPNAVMADLSTSFGIEDQDINHLTSAVQLGFILGTLFFAILMIADRFRPSKVFFWCALTGALVNICTTWSGNDFTYLLLQRATVGFFLAGIYPVGMKIAADYYEQGLSRSLGYLVGALVLGTAFPHILSASFDGYDWQLVIYAASGLAVVGGLMMIALVPDGPYLRASQALDWQAIPKIFKNKNFRGAAFGYFGHMWELYAFWALVPAIITTYCTSITDASSISILAGLIIGIGTLSCVVGGTLSLKHSPKSLAMVFLFSSGICCLLAPVILGIVPVWITLCYLFFWGAVVIADSPLFSTLVARHAPAEFKGTALTVVNCIGFAITIVSIQLLLMLVGMWELKWVLMVLVIGPVLGLLQMRS